jgi:hypothetical protein
MYTLCMTMAKNVEPHLLGYDARYPTESEPILRKNASLPSSGSKNKQESSPHRHGDFTGMEALNLILDFCKVQQKFSTN